MDLNCIQVIMQICCIGLVIAAAGLWAGAGVTMRPKDRDEQTLIGGTIWSQIIIPIGLMISKVVEEQIDVFIEGYYLISGVLLLLVTGIVLIVHETKTYQRRQLRLRALRQGQQALREGTPAPVITYDKAYYAIGVLCVLAGVMKLSEFVVFLKMAEDSLFV